MANTIELKDLSLETMLPVTGNIGEIKIANRTLNSYIKERLSLIDGDIECVSNLYVSDLLLDFCIKEKANIIVVDEFDNQLLKITKNQNEEYEVAELDKYSIVINYAHKLLFVIEEIFKNLKEDKIEGELKNNVNYDGILHVGKNSVILPGVYIEGNVVIGENCKIGPNCYIRGNTSIGNGCHIGQSVEVKNSIIMDKVSVGHLSYLGDSVVCSGVNFGAGTIGSNLRHDGKTHKTMVQGHLVDTNRRKFGCVIGENVHTGINTSIYPGRKIFAHSSTHPGEIIGHDRKVFIPKDE